MLEEFAERIQNAKDKQFLLINRFHIGDTVYPFWLKNFIVYGTVIDIDVVARKVICDFNGVMRQFCPEDLMLVNPNLVQNNGKARKASKQETQLSPDTDNGISAVCKECGGEIAVSYDEKNATTDFVCTQCGKRIPENKLSKKSKKAMRAMLLKKKVNNVKIAKELLKIAREFVSAYPDKNNFDENYDKDSVDQYILQKLWDKYSDFVSPDLLAASQHCLNNVTIISLKRWLKDNGYTDWIRGNRYDAIYDFNCKKLQQHDIILKRETDDVYMVSLQKIYDQLDRKRQNRMRNFKGSLPTMQDFEKAYFEQE